MVKNLKHLLAVAALAAGTAASFAGNGYLKMVGPKPLRLAQVKPALDLAKALPPLIMNDSPSTNSPPAAEKLGPEWEGLPGVDEELLATEPIPEPAPTPTRQVTPDTLLQFFTPGQKRSTVITTPVDFAPPAGTQRSSTATYILE